MYYINKVYFYLLFRRVCKILIGTTWILTFSSYSVIVFATNQYYFDNVGSTCEAYYANDHVVIIATTLFYLPAIITISFCYTNIFLAARRQLKVHPETSYASAPACDARVSHVFTFRSIC